MAENQNTNPASSDLGEFSKKAEAFYNEIKTELEAEHKGKYVAIDFESKKFWPGDTASEALLKAKAEFPSRLFYLVQVGSPVTFTVQSIMKRSGLLRKSYDS